MRGGRGRASRSFIAPALSPAGSPRDLASQASGASYEWEWSGDGGKTWTAVSRTLQAKTEIAGLPVATTVQFRFRAATKTGAGDWSQPTALVVK